MLCTHSYLVCPISEPFSSSGAQIFLLASLLQQWGKVEIKSVTSYLSTTPKLSWYLWPAIPLFVPMSLHLDKNFFSTVILTRWWEEMETNVHIEYIIFNHRYINNGL